MRTPGGTVEFDPTGRRAGRGAYLCADGSCWEAALRRRSIERALSVPLPADLRDRLATGGPIAEGGSRGT